MLDVRVLVCLCVRVCVFLFIHEVYLGKIAKSSVYENRFGTNETNQIYSYRMFVWCVYLYTSKTYTYFACGNLSTCYALNTAAFRFFVVDIGVFFFYIEKGKMLYSPLWLMMNTILYSSQLQPQQYMWDIIHPFGPSIQDKRRDGYNKRDEPFESSTWAIDDRNEMKKNAGVL